MMTKEITIRLRPDQINTVRILYPELSISLIARVLFDSFLNDPYAEDIQDFLHEESSRSNTAMRKHQFKRKEKPNESTELREQLLRSLRRDSDESSM